MGQIGKIVGKITFLIFNPTHDSTLFSVSIVSIEGIYSIPSIDTVIKLDYSDIKHL